MLTWRGRATCTYQHNTTRHTPTYITTGTQTGMQKDSQILRQTHLNIMFKHTCECMRVRIDEINGCKTKSSTKKTYKYSITGIQTNMDVRT
jgi:hypothetical protein